MSNPDTREEDYIRDYETSADEDITDPCCAEFAETGWSHTEACCERAEADRVP